MEKLIEQRRKLQVQLSDNFLIEAVQLRGELAQLLKPLTSDIDKAIGKLTETIASSGSDAAAEKIARDLKADGAAANRILTKAKQLNNAERAQAYAEMGSTFSKNRLQNQRRRQRQK